MMSASARKALAFEVGFGAPNRDPFRTLIHVWADAAASTSRAKTTHTLTTFTRDYEHYCRKALGVDARRVLADARQFFEDHDHV